MLPLGTAVLRTSGTEDGVQVAEIVKAVGENEAGTLSKGSGWVALGAQAVGSLCLEGTCR